jgi:hypothetical protein
VAAIGRFVSQVEIEQRISAVLLRRLCDDNNDGVTDDADVQRLIDDTEAIVIGAAVTEYELAQLPADPTAANLTPGGKLLKSITLKLIQGQAFDKFPEYARSDGTTHTKDAMQLVSMVATAKLRLEGLGADPANVGGETVAFDGDLDEPTRFWNGDGGTGFF